MTRNPQRAPGSWLRRFASLFFDSDTLARVVDPTLADLAHEVGEAASDAEKRSARLRGYLAFWKLVVLSPFVFNDWPGRRQFARSFVYISAMIVLLITTFGARSDWMTQLLTAYYPRLHDRLISIADVGVYAWLLAPIAISSLAIVGRRSPFRVAPSAVILICGATVTAAAAYGGTGFMAAVDAIGRRGSAGISAVTPAMDALVLPSMLALGITAFMTLVLAVSQWRARHLSIVDGAPAVFSSGSSSILLVVSMVVSLVVVNQWLLMNENMIDVMMAALNPQTGRTGGRLSEVAIPFMLLGFVLAAVMLVMSFAAWGRSRSRRPGRFLTWSTGLTIAATLVMCAWHANVIVEKWQGFYATLPH